MLKHGFLVLACFCTHALFVQTAQAQQDGADTAANQANAVGGLNADEAFANVERGDSVGSTGNTGASFSSVSTAAPAGGGGNAGGGGAGGFGGFGGLGGFGNLFGNAFGGQSSGTNKPIVRTRLKSAIAVAPIPQAQVQASANQRFQSLSTGAPMKGVQVTMQGRTAIISGSVSTARERRMSEMLMRLEPGVSRVENRLSVVPQSSF